MPAQYAMNAYQTLGKILLNTPGAARAWHWLQKRKLSKQFAADFKKFAEASAASPSRFPVRWEDRLPFLHDKTSRTGFDRHYVYHTAWAARVLAKTRPSRHIDVSSLLYFAGIVSAFVPTEFYDYRPADLILDNLKAGSANLLALPFADRSVESLSCMHVIEHIGLGRYGDPLDPDGDLKSMAELRRVLAPGGTLLFVVPVGRPRVVYNAHRIYSAGQVKEAFKDLEIKDFALIPDDPALGGLVSPATDDLANSQTYGCGCFWFQRPLR